mmetsp:Transcript_17075/g.66508  ORF Transcript_17075/g.66508 Transcript_17075/m.66508 type:complete len:328 (+) Transcript_17075:185-1168(+)
MGSRVCRKRCPREPHRAVDLELPLNGHMAQCQAVERLPAVHRHGEEAAKAGQLLQLQLYTAVILSERKENVLTKALHQELLGECFVAARRQFMPPPEAGDPLLITGKHISAQPLGKEPLHKSSRHVHECVVILGRESHGLVGSLDERQLGLPRGDSPLDHLLHHGSLVAEVVVVGLGMAKRLHEGCYGRVVLCERHTRQFVSPVVDGTELDLLELHAYNCEGSREGSALVGAEGEAWAVDAAGGKGVVGRHLGSTPDDSESDLGVGIPNAEGEKCQRLADNSAERVVHSHRQCADENGHWCPHSNSPGGCQERAGDTKGVGDRRHCR